MQWTWSTPLCSCFTRVANLLICPDILAVPSYAWPLHLCSGSIQGMQTSWKVAYNVSESVLEICTRPMDSSLYVFLICPTFMYTHLLTPVYIRCLIYYYGKKVQPIVFVWECHEEHYLPWVLSVCSKFLVKNTLNHSTMYVVEWFKTM